MGSLSLPDAEMVHDPLAMFTVVRDRVVADHQAAEAAMKADQALRKERLQHVYDVLHHALTARTLIHQNTRTKEKGRIAVVFGEDLPPSRRPCIYLHGAPEWHTSPRPSTLMFIDAWHPCAHNPSVNNDPRQYYLHCDRTYWPFTSARDVVADVFERLTQMILTKQVEDQTT